MKTKALPTFLLFAAATVLAGCSVADTSTRDVSRTFDEGIHGHGQIVSPDDEEDEAGSDPIATQAKP